MLDKCHNESARFLPQDSRLGRIGEQAQGGNKLIGTQELGEPCEVETVTICGSAEEMERAEIDGWHPSGTIIGIGLIVAPDSPDE